MKALEMAMLLVRRSDIKNFIVPKGYVYLLFVRVWRSMDGFYFCVLLFVLLKKNANSNTSE